MKPSYYRKTIAALAGALLTWAGTAYVPDGTIDRNEWYALAIAVATAVGVYAVTNAAPSVARETLSARHVSPAPSKAKMPSDTEWGSRANTAEINIDPSRSMSTVSPPG